MDTIDILKLASIILVIGLAIVPGIIPIVWQAWCLTLSKCCNENKRCLSYANAFSGGVFLTMGLIHIYPQAVLEYNELHADLADDFPLPQVMFILGYIIILLFEKVVCLNPDEKSEESHHHSRELKVEAQPQEDEIDSPVHKESPQKFEFNGHNNSQSEIQLYQIQNGNGMGSSPSLGKKASEPTKQSMRQYDIDKEKAIKRIADKEANVTCCALGLIIAALSIHSFFEGLALGVSSKQDDVLGLIIGISLHNWAESLSIGANLASKDEKRKHVKRSVIFLIVYTIVSPIGIGIGWALLKFSTSLVAIVSSALSGGTFIYIGATEVIFEEFSTQKNKVPKFFYFLFGFATIVVASAIAQAAGAH